LYHHFTQLSNLAFQQDYRFKEEKKQTQDGNQRKKDNKPGEETNQAESKPQLENSLTDTTETNQEPQKSLHSPANRRKDEND